MEFFANSDLLIFHDILLDCHYLNKHYTYLLHNGLLIFTFNLDVLRFTYIPQIHKKMGNFGLLHLRMSFDLSDAIFDDYKSFVISNYLDC